MFDVIPDNLAEIVTKVRRHDQAYWQRIGGMPDFTGKRVLDFGCGIGTLMLDMLEAGAAEVFGLDIAQNRLDEARMRLGSHVQAGKVTLLCGELAKFARTLPKFDVIVTKDTIEHVAGLDQVLPMLARLLKPGGLFLIGTSPLYYSPFGDHGFVTGYRWPWLHVLKGKPAVLAAINRLNGTEFQTLEAAGLNGLAPRDYLRAIDFCYCDIMLLEINPGTGLKGLACQALGWCAALPGLGRFTVVSLYAVLRHRD